MRLISNGEGKRGIIMRTFATLVVLTIVLMITFFFIVRTDGAREFIEKRLSKRLGISVEIEKARIGFPYVLVIENMRTSDFGVAGAAGISAEEIRIGRRLLTWTLGLQNCILRVKQDVDGAWNPPVCAKIGNWLGSGVEQLTSLTMRFRDNVSIDLVDGEISWLAEDGSEVAVLREVGFSLRSVKVEDRILYYYLMTVYSAEGTPYSGSHDMKREWIATEAIDYIEIAGSDRSVIEAVQTPDIVDAVEEIRKLPNDDCRLGRGADLTESFVTESWDAESGKRVE